MCDAAIDWIRVHVVGTVDRERTLRVGMNDSFCVAECAADVHVCGGVGDDQSRILAAPRSRDFSRNRDRVMAREKNSRQDQADPRHTLIVHSCT